MVTAFFFIMPAISSRGRISISTMPQWMQYFSYAIPLRYFLIVLRGTYLKGVGMDILWRKCSHGRLGLSLLTFAILASQGA